MQANHDRGIEGHQASPTKWQLHLLFHTCFVGVLIEPDTEGEQVSLWAVVWEESRVVGRIERKDYVVACIMQFPDPGNAGLVQADMYVSYVCFTD